MVHVLVRIVMHFVSTTAVPLAFPIAIIIFNRAYNFHIHTITIINPQYTSVM